MQLLNDVINDKTIVLKDVINGAKERGASEEQAHQLCKAVVQFQVSANKENNATTFASATTLGLNEDEDSDVECTVITEIDGRVVDESPTIV